METPKDSKAEKNWEKGLIAREYYRKFLADRTDKMEIQLVDLLVVKNFKGGNATINEPLIDLEAKLAELSEICRAINNQFQNLKLTDLKDSQIEVLVCELNRFFDGGLINGFSYSFKSTLLNFIFPNLIPILDRRVLIGTQIVTEDAKSLDTSFQVKNIKQYFRDLLIAARDEMKELGYDKLDEFDKKHFIKTLPGWAKPRKL